MGKEKLKKKRGMLLLTNKLGKFERLNQEEIKMIINGTVPGLAGMQIVEKRTNYQLEIDTTQLTPLSVYFQTAMDADTVLAFIWNTARIANECERHGLRVDGLRWAYDRVYVDQQGNLVMVYWPVTTLEQFVDNPLSFFYGFCGVLNQSGVDKSLAQQYAAYFYQRSYFDFRLFYNTLAQLMEQWRRAKVRQNREEQAKDSAWMPDRSKIISSGWLEQPVTRARVDLNKEKTVFGRDPTACDEAITGFDGVSRTHAVIYNSENQYFLKDLDSKNGTFLQGTRLKPQEKVPLKDGMTIRFGNATYIFHWTNLNQTMSIHKMQRR